MDIITLFKFSMYMISCMSNVFFIVAVGLSIYWLIFYKGQGLAFVVLPPVSAQGSFTILLIIAFVLKFFDLVHLILVQCSYDIFFIDWERPKDAGSQQMHMNEAQATKVNRSNDKLQEENSYGYVVF